MSINVLVVLILIGGWVSSKVFLRIGLPSVLGMTLWGIFLGQFLGDKIPQVLWDLAPFLKSLALIIILLRAGLGIRRDTLKKVGKTAVSMAIIPCTMEAIAFTGLFYYLMDFSLVSAALCGFLLSAVSPAVVVPSMLNLKDRGYGKKNDIPVLVLAGASLDDVFAITVFSMLLGISTGTDPDIIQSILAIPLSVLGGVIPGLILGYALSWYFSKYYERIRATEKTLLLLGVSVFLLQVGDTWHLATLLGIMTAGFVLLEKAPSAAEEMAVKLNMAWVFAEIILFVLIGMSVNVSVAADAGPMGVLVILCALIVRSAGVWIATAFSGLPAKERLFCIVAYLPKATVQAAMGSVPLAAGVAEGEVILAVSVLAIIITAPLGLIGIRSLGPVLLSTEFSLDEEPHR
jgi:NhaP-type Na+/H+ or K+/H+ antiporter